ncbi:glutathione S-transferase [Xylogone sp. PMI_703]|nr:glutathione S-transferase [Xylogone sp. PMI_703]
MAVGVTKAGVPTLHHLDNSQSQRILWLIEELGIEYNLQNHFRNPKTFRAPPEIKDVQVLGKAPVLVTADGTAITESSAIAAYLIKTYDTTGRFTAKDWIRDETLTSFAGSTLGPIMTTELTFDIAAKRTPWPLVYLARAVQNGLRKNFSTAEWEKDLSYLESELGDAEWFNGGELGRMDIMLSWPLDMAEQRKWVDFAKDYPKLAGWKKRIQEREAWKRGIGKGNGYDLTIW